MSWWVGGHRAFPRLEPFLPLCVHYTSLCTWGSQRNLVQLRETESRHQDLWPDTECALGEVLVPAQSKQS